MGGDSFFPRIPSAAEVESLLGEDLSQASVNSGVSSGDDGGLIHKLEKGSLIDSEDGNRFNFGEYPDEVPYVSMISQAAEKQKIKVYSEVMRSYEELPSRFHELEEAKIKILSYAPGSWGENAYGMDLSKYDVPNTTSLLLIGPKGSGKSSLVNKISDALEFNIFPSERAQVNSCNGDGTYFLHEYMIPRGSTSFCLYDTRSLSGDLSENQELLNRWMTKGVRHGELVQRKSDSKVLRDRLKCKARRGCSSSKPRAIDFVIFVVNGLSVLESMDGDVDENTKEYSQMIASNFHNPLLSFKDDKPVVVVTHGDLFSLTDRVRIRVYLGELLGIPPTKQIFDIPDNDDPATALTIADMLLYCLEHADRNLPAKNMLVIKVLFLVCLFIWMATLLLRLFHKYQCKASFDPPAEVEFQASFDPLVNVKWHQIRHLWSD